MSIEVSVEVTKKISYSYFVIRSLSWILRGRKMLVCTWITFITLETRSLLLSPWGKQRSADCTCRSFPSPPQFLPAVITLESHAILSDGDVHKTSHTSIHSMRTQWVLPVCPTLGVECPAPNSIFTEPNCSWEEEGGGNTGKGTSQPVWRICGGIFEAEGTGHADSQEMDLCALEWRARGQGGWEDENFVATGGVGWGFDYKEPHCHGKEFLF